jgi:predicted nuclease with RNAse H fold
MRVIGIDLSGPSNHRDTILTVFKKQGNQLKFVKWISNLSDHGILKEISEQSHLDEVVVGIDAPLSYEDGGGDRQGDRELRQFVIALGMKPGSIMPPTLNRMVYLTLRGIKLSREIESLKTPYSISIVEVHPGAVIGSRLFQNDIEYVLSYKKNLLARSFIRNWLGKQKLTQIPILIEEESHSIDACAAALGAWHWKDHSLKPKWLFPANPPLHPYDYCC